MKSMTTHVVHVGLVSRPQLSGIASAEIHAQSSAIGNHQRDGNVDQARR